MWPFPKKQFEWREPKQFRRALEAIRTRWWHRPFFVLIWACHLMAIWGLAKLDPNKQALPVEVALLIAFPGGMILMYFLFWIGDLDPPSVMVFDKKLARTGGKTWKYKDITAFALLDCDDFHLLVLEMKNGPRSLVGVPPEVDVRTLADFFVCHGLPQVARPLAAC